MIFPQTEFRKKLSDTVTCLGIKQNVRTHVITLGIRQFRFQCVKMNHRNMFNAKCNAHARFWIIKNLNRRACSRAHMQEMKRSNKRRKLRKGSIISTFLNLYVCTCIITILYFEKSYSTKCTKRELKPLLIGVREYIFSRANFKKISLEERKFSSSESQSFKKGEEFVGKYEWLFKPN